MKNKLIITFIILFILTGCSSQPTQQPKESDSAQLFAMDTYMTYTAYGENCEAAIEAATVEIKRIDDLWSTGNPESEVSLINQNGSATVSDETIDLIQTAIEIYNSTGCFDITIYPLMKLWGFTDGNFKVPEKQQIDQLLNLVDCQQIQIDGNTVTLPQGCAIDFGGIAKGYTSDAIIAIFKQYGIESGLLNLGGNVQTLGYKTSGAEWKVGIEIPDKSLEVFQNLNYVGVLSIHDKAVITSGNYIRKFEEDGVSYHHILDPETGYPAENSLSSVSVICENGTLSDGLSTSLFIMGKEKALQYYSEHQQPYPFDLILVEKDGTVTITEGIQDCFTSEINYSVYTLKGDYIQ